jgi:hypothetical protein
VREVGDAAVRPRRAEVEVAEEDLLDEPEAEDQQRRELDDRDEEDDEDQRHDAGGWEQDQVAAEHARDRPRGTDVRHGRVRPDRDLERRRGEPAEQVEDQELDRPHRVLDVVAEDPQEQHVAAEVQQAAVHEHRGEDGHPGRRRRGRAALDRDLLARVRDLVGDLRVVVEIAGEVLRVGLAERQPALLPEEVRQHVQRDQRDRDGREAERRDVVLQREHRGGQR